MSATEIVAVAAPRYAILRRLTPPDIGNLHSCFIDRAQHLSFDTRHWHVEHDGDDRAAFELACRTFGIEVPS